MFGEVSKDLSQLVRQEVELAKAEAKESATRAGKGAGMLVGAAEAAQLALVFLSVAVWWGLGNAIGRGWSALVVTVVWAVVAAALGLLGKKQVSSVNGLPRTAQTVKEIPPALKPHEEQR
ncbi:phage holin family protein [Angustibacter sp. Root456]|uniref:phage holin family protein n=1 Tax=Angustibacter sp. Root456 TaxID=1736539 RepID=UPI0009EA3FA5